jgi:hypothetical protein
VGEPVLETDTLFEPDELVVRVADSEGGGFVIVAVTLDVTE